MPESVKNAVEEKRKRRMPRGSPSPFAYIPVVHTFSDLEIVSESGETGYLMDIDSDKGTQTAKMYEKQDGLSLLFQILSCLNEREKIVFLYQMLIDFGYDASQDSYAKTMNIHRVTYAEYLRTVREKVRELMQNYNNA